MKKIWSDIAWDEYLYWQTQDNKTLKKINKLIKSIERDGFNKGLGKPEFLREGKALYDNLYPSRIIHQCQRKLRKTSINFVKLSLNELLFTKFIIILDFNFE